MDKKIKDRLIGVATSLVVAAITFLSTAYFSSFITRADYNKDMQAMEVLKTEVAYIRSDIKEIKGLLKRRH